MKYLIGLMVLASVSWHCSSKRESRPIARPISSLPPDDGNAVGGESGGTAAGDGEGLGTDPVDSANQGKNTLVWKRYRAVEGGLAAAMALTKDQLCAELGTKSCVNSVHLSVLGGNEPFVNGQFEGAPTPTALTAVAMDRIVMAACSKRLQLDKAVGATPTVFKYFPLTDAKPIDADVKLQAAELYRRLLGREPDTAEMQLISAFGAAMPAGDRLALSLCVAIGTSAENIFL